MSRFTDQLDKLNVLIDKQERTNRLLEILIQLQVTQLGLETHIYRTTGSISEENFQIIQVILGQAKEYA